METLLKNGKHGVVFSGSVQVIPVHTLTFIIGEQIILCSMYLSEQPKKTWKSRVYTAELRVTQAAKLSVRLLAGIVYSNTSSCSFGTCPDRPGQPVSQLAPVVPAGAVTVV